MAWTPQQDLEEESSSDDLECPVNSSKNIVSNIPGAKFSPRGQLFLSRDHSFSMSLPREDRRLCLYHENGEQKVNYLRIYEYKNANEFPTNYDIFFSSSYYYYDYLGEKQLGSYF